MVDEKIVLRMAELIRIKKEAAEELDRLSRSLINDEAVEIEGHQCSVTTASGRQCKKRAAKPGGLCGVHQSRARRQDWAKQVASRMAEAN